MVSKQWQETWMVHGCIQAISIQDFCQYQTHELLSMENMKFVCLPIIVVVDTRILNTPGSGPQTSDIGGGKNPIR